jgi:hypothetical protein
VTQVSDLKPVKRVFKSLDGQEVVYVGFPMSSEDKFLRGMARLRLDNRIVVEPKETIDEDAFQTWKASVPLLVPDKSKKDTKPPCGQTAPLPPPCGEIHMYPPQDGGVTEADAVVSRLLRFDLATSTPLEAMQFIASLKKMIGSHGTV